jgi:hypothetical protein
MIILLSVKTSLNNDEFSLISRACVVIDFIIIMNNNTCLSEGSSSVGEKQAKMATLLNNRRTDRQLPFDYCMY